jgi:hypothetical protein
MALTTEQKRDMEFLQTTISTALNKALLERGLPYKISGNRCSVGIADVSFTLKMVATGDDAREEAYSRDTKWSKLEHVPFGSTLKLREGEFRVVGYNQRKKTQPVIIEREGRTYFCSDDAVLRQYPLPAGSVWARELKQVEPPSRSGQ